MESRKGLNDITIPQSLQVHRNLLFISRVWKIGCHVPSMQIGEPGLCSSLVCKLWKKWTYRSGGTTIGAVCCARRNSRLARLTRTDIERKLLTGMAVSWDDLSKKNPQLLLSDPRARSLFKFLLTNPVRNPTGLSDAFIAGLAAAYASDPDPASSMTTDTGSTANSASWKLQALETEGFGGLNIWKGPTFRFEFDRESLLIEGPNGSGKSSFVGAILWALTGERPRDHADGQAHESKPVFESSDKPPVGQWPPIACYPTTVADLSTPHKVRVALEFIDNNGRKANVERVLDAGVVTCHVDSHFDIPSVFVETGLLMPTRLAALRLSGGANRLTEAVQKLTGLDDLTAIGNLVDGLCHKSREYLSYEKKELSNGRKDFENAIQSARNTLAGLEVAVPDFPPTDTNDTSSAMGKFGKNLADKAAELTKVIASDLAPGLALDAAATQNQVIIAIGAAEDDVSNGLSSLESWKLLEVFDRDLDEKRIATVKDAIAAARKAAVESTHLLLRSSDDSKFQLKAVAAQWHAQHQSGKIINCPLCEHELTESVALVKELESLRSAGSAAAKTFDDNLNTILTELNRSLPPSQNHLNRDILASEPRKDLVADLRSTFTQKERYSKILVKFKTIVEEALLHAPTVELPKAPLIPDGVAKSVDERIAIIERAIALAEWYRTESSAWLVWWEQATSTVSSIQAVEAGSETTPAPNESEESLSQHLTRLSDAVAKAKPYRSAAESMRSAWTAGKTVTRIEKELDKREKVADLIAPLKQLVSLSQAVARDAIEDLSERIAQILNRIQLTEQLRYHDAQLSKKEGIVVYGAFGNAIRIDAALIANTSWLRAVLWAFTFALREEAVEQFGSDLLPLLVFDDPQATFDAEHRHRWTQYVSSLQHGPSSAQVVLTTYDEMFLELIKIDGIAGRQAMCAAAGDELGHIGIFEGESLDRKWKETLKENTPKAAREYMGSTRVYVEGLLRLMLRGEDPGVSTFVIGQSREKLRQLHESAVTPWNRSDFIETAHHVTGLHLGMGEATDVEAYWRQHLQPVLRRCFHISREYLLIHGGLKALHAAAPLVVMPEGYRSKVAQIPLQVLGRAAALSDGRTADGRFDMNEYNSGSHKKITLGKHSAYRLNAPTLEPVARPGDMLLVKDAGEPSLKSLVVAISEDRVLARRFEVAENHDDIAVLTAQAINPRKIAPPVIAQKSTFILHKIIGVLYEDAAWSPPTGSAMEVCECSGEAVLSGLLADALGLVEVVGQSAEPHALNGQYIIVEKHLSAADAFKRLDGKPVIASDTDDNHYFKRLRVGTDRIVLESMDSGGDYAPVILSMPGQGTNCLKELWPVAGVLFELPT
jgi:energy-coupling factor transporter ATP-binding protein EcfA2